MEESMVNVPWETVFGFDREVGGAAFALLGVGREGDVVGGDVDIHLVSRVSHDAVLV